MKAKVIYWMVWMVGMMGFTCSCSSDDDVRSGEDDFDKLIMDTNIGEVWDGTGIPSWLNDRYTNFVLEEKSDWAFESYWGPTLFNVYKLNYKDNLLVVLEYDRYGLKGTSYYHETGNLCYTKDGRQVKFGGIKDAFAKDAERVWTNELGNGGNVLNVPEVEVENIASAARWLQPLVDNLYEDIKEPKQVLARIRVWDSQKDTDTYIVFEYEYFDKDTYKDGAVQVREVYTSDGEKVDEPADGLTIGEYCEQLLTSILDGERLMYKYTQQ